MRSTVSYPIYEQMRSANQTTTDIAAFAPTAYNVIVGGQADIASALEASGNFFDVLQLRPALGRTFTTADDSLSASAVAVISDAYWRRRFNGERTVVNMVVTVSGHQVRIVGVTPRSFTGVMQLGDKAPDITIPLAFDDIFTHGQSRMNDATYWWLLLIGRLKPGMNAARVDVGFDPSNLLMFSLRPELNGYVVTRTFSMYDRIDQRLAALPGVRAVALTRVMPLSGSTSAESMWADRATDRPAVSDMYLMTVSADYFSTIGISLIEGRTFNDRDTAASAKVAVVNETAAKLLFPEGNALGRHIGDSLEERGSTEIVGVARDTKYASARDAAPPTMYFFWRQQAALDSTGKPEPGPSMTFIARTAADPDAIAQTVRELVGQVDSNVPVTNMTTQAEQIEALLAGEAVREGVLAVWRPRAPARVHRPVRPDVLQRRAPDQRNRHPDGARRSAVVRLVLDESLVLVGIGIGIGVASTFAAGGLVEHVLFGVAPRDATTLSVAVCRPEPRAHKKRTLRQMVKTTDVHYREQTTPALELRSVGVPPAQPLGHLTARES